MLHGAQSCGAVRVGMELRWLTCVELVLYSTCTNETMIHIYKHSARSLTGWVDGWSELPRSQALLQGLVLHGRGCWRRRPDGGAIRLQTKTENALRCDTFTTQRVSACSRRNTMQYTESFISVYLLAAGLLPTQMALYEYTTQRAVVSWCSQNHRTCCSPPPKRHGRASGAWVACWGPPPGPSCPCPTCCSQCLRTTIQSEFALLFYTLIIN
jgi:hypothetical protein